MTYTNLIKTGLGLGLLAVSLGADATPTDGRHNFGSSSIYFKNTSTGFNYTSFQPTGNQSTDSVLVVEHLQGTAATTPMTWNYMLPVANFAGLSGASSTNIPAGSLIGTIFSPSATSWAVQSGSHTATSTVSVSGFNFASQGQGFVASASVATQISSSYTNMLWDIPTPIAYPFSYSTSISSSQCNVTAIAVIDTNDYLQWGGIVAQAVGYKSVSSPAANGTVSYISAAGGVSAYSTMSLANDNVSVVWLSGTKSSSGTSGATNTSYTTYTASNYMSTFGSAAWNNMQTATSASISFPTNATIIMPVGTGYTAGGTTYTLAFSPNSTAAALSWGTNNGVGGGTSPAQNATFGSGYFTMAGSQYKAAAGCGAAYTARAALNSSSPSLGGKGGLMRLW